MVTATSLFALRFISGKYQGGEFPLHPNREIVIGRSSDLDMVLVEDMVSRKHAKIEVSDGTMTIEDLGSTNGTFVNGEKVQRTELIEGDRILIGTSIIKLITVDPTLALSEEAARKRLEQTAEPRGQAAAQKPMSGSIAEIPLPDLMQLLSTSRKSGVLSLRGESAHGKIYFRKGQVYFAVIDESHEIPPRKAIYRMLTWSSGTFELGPPAAEDAVAKESEIDDPTEGLLMEGMRQLDEMNRIVADLPPRNQVIGLMVPLSAPLNQLSPLQLEVLQLVINGGRVGAVLDRSRLGDNETAQLLLELIKKEYVRSR